MMHLIDYKTFKKTCAFFMLAPNNLNFIFIGCNFLIMILFIIWANVAPIDTIITAPVELTTQTPVSEIRAMCDGKVLQINYTEETAVKKGELLYKIDTRVLEKEYDYLKSHDDKLANDILINEALEYTMLNDRIPLDAKPDTEIYSECASYLYKKNYYEETIEQTKQKLETERNAPSGFYIAQNIKDLESSVKQQTAEYEAWKNEQMKNMYETKKTLHEDYAEAETRIQDLERSIANAVVYAPISGRINILKDVNIGDYIFNGESILRIIPDEKTNLIARIYIDPSSIALVKKDNPVKIKFNSLSTSQYGQIETFIKYIPPAPVSSVNNGSFFIALSDIKDNKLTSRKGQTVNLISGMNATAKIVTERTTLMHKILQKLEFIE